MGTAAAPTEATGTDAGASFARAAVAVTLIPFGVLVVATALGARGPLVVLVGLVLGTPHVLATAGLYLDRELREVVRDDRLHAVVLPLVAVGASAVAFGLARGDAATGLLVAFLIWQIHHFTKQNLGMLAFWLRATGRGGLTAGERRLIRSTTLVGALGIVRMSGIADGWDSWIRAGGLVIAVAGATWLLARPQGARTLALLVPVVFYLPVHVFTTDLVVAALAYEAAHGAQYYLMVGQVTGAPATARTSPLRFARGLVVYAAAAALLLTATLDYDAATAWAYGLGKGVVAAHFVADARLWRLRNPAIRDVMRRRFAFL